MSVALYRKYRPQDFGALAGQDHIAKSLENALKSDRISHAYLFSGPRGVGKTSMARILARRANQLKPEAADSHLDIIEIDAASNRRIDEIRDLREKVHLAPAQGKYKIYIIDEVHMLTTEAFNALLKTLEEPPAHVIFILATTEPHKLPETIISRTQRYSFRPIELAVLAEHLGKIAKAEKIVIDDAALQLIAEAGSGSVRDSISILDQAANITGGKIDAAAVTELLGLGDRAAIEQLALALANRDSQKTLELLDSYRAQGGAAAQLLQQLLRLLHHLLRCSLQLEQPRNQVEQTLTEVLDSQTIVKLVQRLTELPQNSAHLEIALEASLIQLAATGSPQPQPQIEAMAIEAKAPTKQADSRKSTPKQPATRTAKSKPSDGAFSDSVWPKVLTLVKQHNNSLYALLRSASAELQADVVTIHFRFQFHRRRLEETKNRQLLQRALAKVLNKPISVEAVVTPGPSPAADEASETKENKQAVDSVIQILGGEVMRG